MIKPKIIFIPGNGGGTVSDHWFPWLKEKLERENLLVVAKIFPDSILSRSEYWLPFIKNSLKADKNSILIGHSSGAIAAMRFAEKHFIAGSVLVAPYYTDLNDYHEKISGYFDKPWDWSKIIQHQNFIAQFSSCDDPYIPIEEARYVKDMLHSDYIEFLDGGHLGDDKNLTSFPELFSKLMQNIKINFPF